MMHTAQPTQPSGRGTRTRAYGPTGSALLIVLWAIALMSLVVLGVLQFVGFGLDESTVRSTGFLSRQLAESGVAVAMNPKVEPGDPLLRQTFPDGGSFSARIGSEDGRLNINQLLNQEGAEPGSSALTAMLTDWGLQLHETDHVIDCLIDWTDPDDLARRTGAELDQYAALKRQVMPANKPFTSVHQMAAVIGMELVESFRPDWQNYFSVYAGSQLDVNEASEEMLAVVAGLTEQQADAVVRFRVGADGEKDTDDDERFESLEEFQKVAGMAQGQFQNVASKLTVQGQTVRIESTGRFGRRANTIVVVKQREGAAIFSWQEN